MRKTSRSGQYVIGKDESKKLSVSCNFEHGFAVIKILFGYRKAEPRSKTTDLKTVLWLHLLNFLADKKSRSI